MQRIVAADPVLAAWDARRRHEALVTQAVRTALPRQLAARIRVADAQHPTLEIVADSGAVAAAVRQRLPGVIDRLAKDGWPFTATRVHVQPRADPIAVPKSPRNPLDAPSIRALARLAATLPDGPLKRSVDRLLRQSR
jgi:hypothetical protein